MTNNTYYYKELIYVWEHRTFKYKHTQYAFKNTAYVTYVKLDCGILLWHLITWDILNNIFIKEQNGKRKEKFRWNIIFELKFSWMSSGERPACNYACVYTHKMREELRPRSFPRIFFFLPFFVVSSAFECRNLNI